MHSTHSFSKRNTLKKLNKNHIIYTRMEFRGISVCQVPREARLVLVLYGRTLQPAEHESNSSAENAMQKEELGWGAIQFFDYDG